MAAEDIQIVCFDPAFEENFSRATIFTRRMRTGFRFSHSSPGGNVSASFSVSCDHLADVGFPKGKARILIQDPVREKYLWRGVLKKPKLHYERGRLSSVLFEAIGCAEGSWRQFPDPTVFGPPTIVGTVTSRHDVVNIGDIMQFGLTQAPLIDGTQTGIGVGGVLTEDTHDYRGQTPAQLWEDVCNLTRGYGTPFTWMIEPDDMGLAALSFFAEAPNPRYFEHGNAKTTDLEVDYNAIANIIYAMFNGTQIQVPPVGDPVDYTNTPDIQTAYINVGDVIREYNTAAGFAENLYNKFNQRVVTGGSIVLDREIRTNMGGSPEMIPIYEVRAGRAIEVEITKIPYLPDVQLDIIIKTAEYDEDACTMTLTPAILTEEGKSARMLAIRSEMEQAKISWAWTDRALTSPAPVLAVGNPAESGIYAGAITDGSGVSPGTGKPSVSRNEPNNTSYSPTGIPLTYVPNSIPKAYNHTVPTGVKAWIMQFGAPVTAVAREGMPGLGTLGRKVHPQELPDERINIPATFGTADPLTGGLSDGERLHTDIQEGWIDTFTISVLDDVETSVTVHVDIFNWDDDAIRVTDAFVLSLAGASRVRYQFDNSDDDHRPVQLYHGDQLIWRVEDPTDDVILNCALSGDKSWGEFPVLVGPDWIPGNQA